MMAVVFSTEPSYNLKTYARLEQTRLVSDTFLVTI